MGRTFSSRTDVLSPVRVAGPAVAAHPRIRWAGACRAGACTPRAPEAGPCVCCRPRTLRVLPPPYDSGTTCTRARRGTGYGRRGRGLVRGAVTGAYRARSGPTARGLAGPAVRACGGPMRPPPAGCTT